MKGLFVLLTISLGFSWTVFSAEPAKVKQKVDKVYGTDLPISAEHLIEIKSYDPKTQSYEVFAVQFPGEDATFVTPEGLAKAIKTIDLNRIKKLPKSIIGQQFKTDQALPGLTDEELKLRSKN